MTFYEPLNIAEAKRAGALLEKLFGSALCKQLPHNLIPHKAVNDGYDKLHEVWERSWQRAFQRLEEKRQKWVAKAEPEDEEELADIELLAWAQTSQEKARRDYWKEWLVVAGLAYIAAVGIERLRESERRKMLAVATEAAKAEDAKLKAQIQAAIAQIERELAEHPELAAKTDAVIHIMQRTVNTANPALSARQGLEAFIERTYADVTRGLDPLKEITAYHKQMGYQVKRSVNRFSSGQISREEWRAEMKGIFRENYREAYRLGKVRAGGDYMLTEADNARLNKMLVDEGKFLNKWMRDAEGKYLNLPEEIRLARMQWRGGLYADALQGVFNSGWLSAIPSTQEVFWQLGIAEHCEDCIYENSLGWRLPDELTRTPGDGSTECRTNCQCWLESRERPNEESMPAFDAAGGAPRPQAEDAEKD